MVYTSHLNNGNSVMERSHIDPPERVLDPPEKAFRPVVAPSVFRPVAASLPRVMMLRLVLLVSCAFNLWQFNGTRDLVYHSVVHHREQERKGGATVDSAILPNIKKRALAGVYETAILTTSLEDDASSLPLSDLEIVIGHCKEDLSYLDDFGSCDRLRFHVFSPCGGEIPEFKRIQDCVKIHRDVKDCGRETYSYFDYIIKRYDTLPEHVAFLQGEGKSENPEIVRDLRRFRRVMMTEGGVSYAGLGRMVSAGWHMKDDAIRWSLQDRLAPGLRAQESWNTSWRSQFVVSRSTIQRHPRSAYIDLNKAICEKKCQAVQCHLEVWLGPLFGCAPYLFDESKCKKETLDWALPVAKVASEGIKKRGRKDIGTVSTQTNRITCGNRTMFFSKAGTLNNGILLCTGQ